MKLISLFHTPSRPRNYQERYDSVLLWLGASLLLLGLVMIYSASIALPDAPKYGAYANSHFLWRQAVAILVAVAAGAAAFLVPMKWWEEKSAPILLASLTLLVLVLIPGVGRHVNGARRWLSLGPVGLQPSEFMKFAMVLYVAGFAVRRRSVLHTLRKGFGPITLTLFVAGVLLILEPDLGAFSVIVAIALGVLFVGGVNVVWFGGLAMLLSALFGLLIATSPWRRQRFFAYLDPWDMSNALGKGYQLSHSLIAFGRGEIFGVGLGASVEKLHYLPEAHTDFLLAVVGEELGFVGIAAVLSLFYLLVKRCFVIGRRAADLDNLFSALVAQGVGIWIGTQAIINGAVATGLLPTKGLTLPLMSYGGSGLLANCMALALVLRIDHENRHGMRISR
jgi:cell division protein FtsW